MVQKKQGATCMHSHTHARTRPMPSTPPPCTCTVTPRCLQQTPWPLLLCFSPKALRGIEATSPWSSPVCVCSCRTCPVHARAACISCSSEPAAGTWAGKAAGVQRRVKKRPHSSVWGLWLILERMSERRRRLTAVPCVRSQWLPPHSSLPPRHELSHMGVVTHKHALTHSYAHVLCTAKKCMEAVTDTPASVLLLLLTCALQNDLFTSLLGCFLSYIY